MPQLFQVLNCYKCSVFQLVTVTGIVVKINDKMKKVSRVNNKQILLDTRLDKPTAIHSPKLIVHQTKKSNKWQCKLCGEKQSIKRHYGLGTAKDCRLHVQKLNGIRGEKCEVMENTQNDTDDDEYNEPTTVVRENPPKKSKWSDYVDDEENNENEMEDVMNLGNADSTLDVTNRKRKFKNNSFKVSMKNKEEISEVQRDSNGCEEILQMLSEKSNVPPQESFIRNSYYKTQDDYNSTALEKSLKHKECFKVRTDMSIPIKSPKQDTRTHSPSAFVSLKINKNSKWAQYVDSEENNEEENSDISKSHKDLFHLNKDPQSMFSLHDDEDLDDLLDI